MQRFLACTCVLVGTALVGATEPRTPNPRSEGEMASQDTKDTAQGVSSSAKHDATQGESNERLSQPKRIEDSYPLTGDDERQKSVKGLQQLTVDLLAMYNMFKEAHWNLTGPLYLQLHEYYQQQADFYLQQSDLFAERVLHLGSSVDGRYSTIARTTKIPEMPSGYLTDDGSIRLLVDRVTVLQKEIYQFIRETEDGDPPTSNKLQDLAYSVDKNLWQLRSHVQKPGGQGEDLPWVSQHGRDHSGR